MCSHLLSAAVSVQVWPEPAVREGQLARLTCQVWTRLSAHQLTYAWYRDGQLRPGARSILLPNVTVADAASYRCSVTTPGQLARESTPVALDVICECAGTQQELGGRSETQRSSPWGSEPHTTVDMVGTQDPADGALEGGEAGD